MADFDNIKYTIQHVMAASTEDGAMLEIADVISKTNELNAVLPFFPTNLPFSNRSARDVTHFEPSARVSNTGAVTGVNETEQVTDTLVRFETEVAVDELALNGINDKSQWFTDQIKKTAMGFSNVVADQFISGDYLADPDKQFDGLLKRNNALPASSVDVTDRYYNVIPGGGSGSDNTSIYLVGLGKEGVHGIYFKNDQAGLVINRKGRQRVTDSSGNPYWAETAQMIWDVGLVATNHRAMGRICNIDDSALTLDAATGANLTELMIQLLHNVNHSGMGLTPYWLMSNKLKTYFHSQITAKANVNIAYDKDDFGKIRPMFGGVPILRMDAIGIAEATVS
jgi:hypothetical protein